MPSPWIKYPLNFRPDQIEAYQEKFPNVPFAPKIRALLDMALDGQNPAPKGLEEVRKQTEKAELRAIMMRAELEKREKEEQQKENKRTVETERALYLSKKPEILVEFRRNTISHIGFKMLQRELKFTSRKQVEAYLSSLEVK